jgi:thioredoxin reductase (NADPH)
MNGSYKKASLPLTRARKEQIFQKLPPEQILRIEGKEGNMRDVQAAEVLVEQGDGTVQFFVVVSGELEVVRPSGAVETLVTIHGPGEYTGEINMLSGRRSIVRIRATKPGKVMPLNHQNMMALI